MPSERVDEGDGRATYGDSYTRMELTTGLSYPILYEQGLMSKSVQCSSAQEEMPLLEEYAVRGRMEDSHDSC